MGTISFGLPYASGIILGHAHFQSKKTSFGCRRNHIDKLRSRSMIFVSVGWVTYVGVSDNNYLRIMLIVIGPMLQEAYTISPSPKRSSPESDSPYRF